MKLRIDSVSSLQWERRGGRYWTHITLGKAGNRLDYFQLDKSGKAAKRTEVVTKRGLFNDASLKSITQLPILLAHPKGKRFNLNAEGLKVGQLTGTIARADDDSELIAEAFIDDHRAVSRIDQILAEGGKPEASPCYDLDDLLRTDEAGIFEQIRGAYDHVAAPLFVGQGRGGRDIGLHLDSASDAEMAIAERLFFIGTQKSMTTIRIDGKDYEVEEPVKAEIDRLRVRLDSMDKRPIEDILAERAAIWDKALPILRKENPDYRADYGMSLDEVRIAAVAIAKPELKSRLDSLDLNEPKDSGWLEGTFDFLADDAARADRADSSKASPLDEVLEVIKSGRALRAQESRSDARARDRDTQIQAASENCWS